METKIQETAEILCKWCKVDINKLTAEQLKVVYFLAENFNKD